ncbi:EthD domain-containing protein [Streptomyces brasiliensis]|uniref:EthD domain-containing protein n=1 Tax=Streptomyces brasiliensis TaxID=1954 RepID=A0A917P9A7_9ACTN|nr:EthD family reductase [Streptomyces brasiliensis]GGJ67456.1 hypothetical protein GCM10010121_092700 [Streptomyces brasiliensis]
MLTWVVPWRRAAGVSVADFRAALTASGGLVADVPGLRAATRALTTDPGYAKGDPVYDAVDEWTFADAATARTALASPEARRVAEAHGADPDAVPAFLTTAHVLKDGPVRPDGLVNYEFVRRSPSLSVAEFGRYWREHHGPLAARIPQLRRYVQRHTVAADHDPEPAWEGAAVTWFDDLAAMRASGATREYARTRDDEEAFLADAHRLPFVITQRRVLVAAS